MKWICGIPVGTQKIYKCLSRESGAGRRVPDLLPTNLFMVPVIMD
jgi:hypothetical protein